MKEIKIEEKGIIKEQIVSLQDEVSIIYGLNNGGKTTLLKLLNAQMDKAARRSIIEDSEFELSLFLPTNRLVVSNRYTKEYNIDEAEELLNYKTDMYQNFALHLSILRENLLKNKSIHDFVINAVNEMFDTDIEVYENRYSDGIEDIINIYLNIIWILTWNEDYEKLTKENLNELITERSAHVLIDEIEMFLHVKIQDKFIQNIKKDFPKCNFIFTTHSPLLLTRYKDVSVYNLENGYLKDIDFDGYFADLDYVYESLFGVKELPEEVRGIIDYFGEVIMGEKEIDKEKILKDIEFIENTYPNIAKKYNKYILKAELLTDNCE